MEYENILDSNSSLALYNKWPEPWMTGCVLLSLYWVQLISLVAC